MKIIGIPALTDSYENYIWLIQNNQNAWVVDPGESAPVLDYLSEHALTLRGILVTHAHHDHVNGIPGLKKPFPSAIVFGPKQAGLPLIEKPLQENDRIELDHGLSFDVLETPGHTEDHIAYFNEASLFCGDTLFSGGCGKNFTGRPDWFADSILKLRRLDDRLAFYSAHEYTVANLKFACLVEPENAQLIERIRKTEIRYPEPLQQPQSTLGEEKATNPFMRFDTPAIQNKLVKRGAEDTPAGLFKALREWKDELDHSGELDNVDLQAMAQKAAGHD